MQFKVLFREEDAPYNLLDTPTTLQEECRWGSLEIYTSQGLVYVVKTETNDHPGIGKTFDVEPIPNLDRLIYEATKGRTRGRFDGECGVPSLSMNYWHCGTSHCRAGWASILAGEEGLERAVGPEAAGAMIYYASTGSIPDFFTDDTTAMASIKKAAGIGY